MRGKNLSTGFYRSRHGSIFGVLKGISEYFAINVLWLRIGAIVALFMTGFFPVIIIYTLLAMVMKREPTEPFRKYQSDNKNYKARLYRSRDGMVTGLLRGVSDRLDLSLFWLRVIVIVTTFFTGFVPGIVIYIITSFLVGKEPVVPVNNMEEEEFFESYTHSREGAIHRVKRRFDKLENRIRRMESNVTDRDFDWGHKINSNHS